MNNLRGSVWRKWDLHVHTKNTVKNDQFTSLDFESFCITFFKKALEKNIAAIGITDYFSIENYKKIKKFVSEINDNSSFTDEEKLKIKNIFILPNVELRMLPVTDSGRLINIHCLFNPDYVDDLDNDFFGTIEFSSGSRKYKMNKQGIIGLGKFLDSSLVGEMDQYKKGVNNFVVSHESLQKLLDENENLKTNTIIVVSNSNKDGASALQKHYDLFEDCDSSSLDAVRKSIYCISKAVFSANNEDRKYFLGQKKDDEITVKSKCGSLKACIHGSDAHTEEKLFSPDGERFCWIKADPTFEGLKQIVYEPDDRVRIQELEPEEKDDYQVIDRVNFIDDKFYPGEILINQNLTTIIGGKSTGKSILLRNIAEAIDSNEVAKRLKEVNIYPSLEVSDFHVIWRSKQENKKSEKNESCKKIIYIPQSYLNRLADVDEAKTPIDEIIESVLIQDKDVETVFSELQKQNRELATIITQDIENLFYKERDIASLNENLKRIGDRKGIEIEIDKLQLEVAEFKKKAGMTNDEILQYNDLSAKITNLQSKQDRIEKDLSSLLVLKSQKNFGMYTTTQNLLDSLDPNIQEILVIELNIALEEAEIKWKEKIDSEYKKIEKQKIENQGELNKLFNAFNPLLDKVQKSKSLDEKIKKLEGEMKNQKEIIEQENRLQALKKDYDDLIEKISKNHSKFFDNFFNAKTEILKQNIITEDLEFNIDIVFQKQSFQSFINDVFNLYSIKKFGSGFLEIYNYSNNSEFKREVESIVKGILSGDLVLKNSYSKKEAITRLSQSWFIFDYKIKQNGDEISKMSPGKKSFVLLKLLIELDNSRCPILLDQPEDDLDNRSIYNDLVKFIRTKKKERQIIIATHNPNLVVGADSEVVIVANQTGDQSRNRTYKFEYVQGALENTFLNEASNYVLEQRGIQEHVCDILEGGKLAFEKRKKKYNF